MTIKIMRSPLICHRVDGLVLIFKIEAVNSRHRGVKIYITQAIIILGKSCNERRTIISM